MTMANGWQKAYQELKDFIAWNPRIEIGESVISIPEDLRLEFYRLFDMVRVAFVEEKFPLLLDGVTLLSESYFKVEQEVTELLGLDSISVPGNLHKFLSNPKERLIEGVFDSLFDLLKGEVDFEVFEWQASRELEGTFRGFYHSGYEKWVALSLLKLLEPDTNFHITLDMPVPRQRIRHPPPLEGLAPSPEESRHLSFEHQPSPTFTVPDFIVRSTKLNGYVALRSGFVMPMAAADNASKKREWFSLNSVQAFDPHVILLFVDDNPEDISLVADKDRICRPDLMIKCMVKKDWYQKADLEEVKLHHDTLNPKMGTYVIYGETTPILESGRSDSNIYILTVGFDTSKLASVINTLEGKESCSFAAQQ